MRGIKVQSPEVSDADSEPDVVPNEGAASKRTVLDTALAASIFLAAAAAVFTLIHSDAVNVLRFDQWNDIRLIQRSYNGTLSFSSLWAQHNENRMFFQNLVTIVLAHTVHFNVLVEDYLTAILLVLAAALFIWTHRARSTVTPWIAYVPFGLLMLSAVQWGTFLFGFEIGWAMIMLAFAVTLWLLDRPVLGTLSFGLAIAAAIAASYTSLQGLLIWPAALALLYQRRRSRSQLAIWAASAVVTTLLYFVDWDAGSGSSYVLAHPVFAIEFYFVAIGDVVGAPLDGVSHSTDLFVGLLGVAIVACALWTICVCGLRRDEHSGSPIGVSLIWFGLLFALMITGARASIGLPGAAQSRYTTFDLLILAGIWLALVGRLRAIFTTRATQLLGVVVVGAICLQVVLGASEGISAASGYRQVELTDADITANINQAPDGLVASTLGAFQSAGFIRQMARFAKDDHLAMFSTGSVAGYVRAGLPADKSPPTSTIAVPKEGAALKGVEWLVTVANDLFGITRVECEYSGAGRSDTAIGPAGRAPFGWLCPWDTRSVTNGTYTLFAVATDPSGLTGTSAGVVVTVRNP